MDIIYQDATLLVVNKPAGIATLPDGYNPTLPHIKSILEQQYSRLWIVHRLDKDTSGVLVLARTAYAHRSLNTQFEQRQVSKVYHALVFGNPDWHETTVNMPLRPNGDRQHRTVVDPQNGKPAVTHLTVLERFGEHSLLQAIPETGRTHQIRAHLASLGFYIVGDKLYARRIDAQVQEKARKLDLPADSGLTMGLHAVSLELSHPLSGERLIFRAPYPAELAALIEYIRKSSVWSRDIG
jgi:RluA family pseudouridine synthase